MAMSTVSVRLSEEDRETLDVCKALLTEDLGKAPSDGAVVRLALADYRVMLGVRKARGGQ